MLDVFALGRFFSIQSIQDKTRGSSTVNPVVSLIDCEM